MASPTNEHQDMQWDPDHDLNDMHGHGGSVESYAYLAAAIASHTVGGVIDLPEELMLRDRSTQTLYLWAPELSTFLNYPRFSTNYMLDPVLSTETAPPPGPAIGARYLIGAGATGDWTGLDDQIAQWDGSTWQYTSPIEGYQFWHSGDDLMLVYDGTAWRSEDPNVVDPSVVGNVPRFSDIHGEMEDSGLKASGDSVTLHNIFAGKNAGSVNTTGFDNVFIGEDAGAANTEGSDNTFVGRTAGAKNITGIDNVFLGHDAGWSNTAGQDNTFVGRTAGLFNDSGDDNSYFGRGAGEDALGNKNSIFGSKAGYSHQNGDENSIFGYYAGADGGTKTGSVFFGAYAGRYETASNKLFIDGIDRTDEATARTNSLIYGIFHATPASQYLYVNANFENRAAFAGNPGAIFRNISYGSGDAAGTSSLQFGFLNHVSSKIECYKTAINISGLKLYGEYGFDTPILMATFAAKATGGDLTLPGDLTVDENTTLTGTVSAPQLITSLTEVTEPNWFDDMLSVYDSSAGANKKISIYNLFLNPKWGWFSKCDSSWYEGGLLTGTSGTGSGATSGDYVSDTTTYGIYRLYTGSTDAGRARIYSSPVVFGNGRVFFVGRFKTPSLSDVTENYTIRMGFDDGTTGDGADSIMFRQNYNVNGGKYECVTRSNSNETVSDSGIAGDTNWNTFQIEVNANASSVVFKINGSTVQTHTLNIPTGTARFTYYQPANIIKSAGTATRYLDYDYLIAFGEFVTPRP